MSNLKKITFMVFLSVATLCFGQKGRDKDKIKTLKVAFLTERLDLSTEEAQSFWPIYNEYEENRQKLRQKERQEVYRKLSESESLSENEANAILDQYLNIEEEEEELDKAFIKSVSKVISAKRTLILLRSEEEFKRQLIRQYRKKNSGGGFR